MIKSYIALPVITDHLRVIAKNQNNLQKNAYNAADIGGGVYVNWREYNGF